MPTQYHTDPILTPVDATPLGFATRNTRLPPNGSLGEWASTVIHGATLRPPDPAVGGQPGVGRQLGWSTGLQSSRAMRQRFSGRVLAVPTMGVHPAYGPVGFSTRTQRLANGVAALNTDYTPTSDHVAQSFVEYGG